MNPGLLKRIDGHIFRNVGEYFEKYFGSYDLEHPSLNILEEHLAILDEYIHHDMLDISTHDKILSWLNMMSKDMKSFWQKTSKKDTGVSIVQLGGGSARDEQPAFIRAIGVIVSPKSELYRQGLAELCMTAASIFQGDPLRLFVHGFIIWGTITELWTIDRSGLYSCEPFDLHIDPKRFFDVITAYNSLQENKLGANTFVRRTKDGDMVFVEEPTRSRDVQALYLRKRLNESDSVQGVINESPTVYVAAKTQDIEPNMVVKFKWRREFLHSEGDYFMSMNGSSPRGVVQLYHAEDIESTSNLRAGLIFGDAVILTPDDDNTNSHVEDRTKLPSCFVTRPPETPGNEAYMNRILSCIALYPRGVALEEYKTPFQVIKAFRDALQGHRTLYQQCGILHRDVSPMNILLADTTLSPTSNDNPTGFLIDIESALSSKLPPRRNQIVGTRTFNAIRLLQLETPQTYRGDLESFLYSLVWFCVHRRSTTHNPVNKSRLQRWNGPLGEDLANLKLNDMREQNFANLLDQFHTDFRPFRSLAEGIRKVLFPVLADGSLWTGTDHSVEGTNALYDGMLREFDMALSPKDIQHRV